MISFIHKDVFHYIITKYLYYYTDLHNLRILNIEVKNDLSSRINKLLETNMYGGDCTIEYKVDDIKVKSIERKYNDTLGRIIHYKKNNIEQHFEFYYDKSIKMYNKKTSDGFLQELIFFWYKNGVLSQKTIYDVSNPLILYSVVHSINFYDDGKLRYHTYFTNNKEIKNHIQYLQNGKIDMEQRMKYNIRTKEYEEYDAKYYCDGKLIE